MTPRVVWLNETYLPKLTAKLNQEAWPDYMREVFAAFVKADPTPNKRFTQWLLRTFLADGFRLEDLSKARQTLVMFTEHQGRLAVEERDVARYSTLADLWKAVKQFQDVDLPLSGKQARRVERSKAYEESIILLDTAELKAVVPLSEYASCWWGRGTRWCTAADDENAFYNYHANAPLVILIFADGSKWQLFIDHEGAQMMDEDDSEIDASLIQKRWPLLKPFLEWMLLEAAPMLHHWTTRQPWFEFDYTHGALLAVFRLMGISSALHERLFSLFPCAVAEFPFDGKITDEQWLSALAANALTLAVMPKRLLTEEVLKKACNHLHADDIAEFEDIIGRALSLENLRILVKNDPHAILFADFSACTYLEVKGILGDLFGDNSEFCGPLTKLLMRPAQGTKHDDVSRNDQISEFFRGVDWTPERVEDLLGSGLDHFFTCIPPKRRNRAAWMACAGHSIDFDEVPKRTWTKKLILRCLENCPSLQEVEIPLKEFFSHVPEKWLTEEFFLKCVRANRFSMATFPGDFPATTEELIMEDGHHYAEAADFERLEPDALDRILRSYPELIANMPDYMQTEHAWVEAARLNPLILSQAPPYMLTEDVMKAAAFAPTEGRWADTLNRLRQELTSHFTAPVPTPSEVEAQGA